MILWQAHLLDKSEVEAPYLVQPFMLFSSSNIYVSSLSSQL